MRLAVLLAVGSAVGVTAAQPGANPASILKDIEGPIRKSKTIRTDIAVDIGPENLGALKGKLVVAAGNKVRLELAGTMKGEKGTMLMVADGKSMRMSGFGSPGREQPIESNLTRIATDSFARVGIFVPLFMAVESVGPDDAPKRPPFDLDRDFAVSDLKLITTEPIGGRETRAVGYKVKTRALAGEYIVTAWADAKTNLPVKRAVAMAEGKKTFVVTETYANTVLDGKVEDSEFAVGK